MKKLLLILCLFTVYLLPKAQRYGNEWIDYTATHYKITLSQDGIYRIPYSELSQIWPNLSALTVNTMAMYHNGDTVPIYIYTPSNAATFVPGSYIEFYGRKNIGDVDSVLYKTGTQQPHPYYSLFTDASAYYLTVKPSGNNRRYVETPNNLTNLPAKENYFNHTTRLVHTGRYYEGKYYSIGSGNSSEELYKSIFEDGEGFVNSTFFGTIVSNTPAQQTQLTFTLNTPAVYTAGPQAKLNSVFINHSTGPHTVTIDLNNTNVLTQSNNNFNLHRFTHSFSPSQLVAGNSVRYSATSATGVSNSRQQNAVCLTEIVYPRQFDFGGDNKFYFEIEASPNRKYIEVTNFNDNGLQPYLYDLTNNLVIRSTQPAGSTTLRFALPPSSVKREMYLISGGTGSYTNITASQIKSVNFVDYSTKAAEFVIVYHPSLNTSSDQAVQEYRDYRANHNFSSAEMFDVEQLYEQFSYGIYKSPLAIRNFMQYAIATWSTKPTHLLLIGKGREYNVMRNGGANYNQCLVPTFGFPGSDNLLGATRQSDTLHVAVGRIAAGYRSQVRNYLKKLQEYEAEQEVYATNQAIPPKIWQKQVLHFSGGTSTQEQTSFKNYNRNYERIVRDTSWGANVTAFSRNTASGPIDESMSQIIKGKINDGVSWLTFFGHSATGAFDFSIDEPENYNNVGKYPIILSNGCFSGLIHDRDSGYSERFVLIPNKGSIAFIATSSLSLSPSLNVFSDSLYKQFAYKTYTQSLGADMRRTLNRVFIDNNTNTTDMVAYEMTLHGDPGLKPNQYAAPDYAIDETSLYFTPSIITPGIDSFEVNLIVTNLGKAVKDSIDVSLTRRIFDQQNNNAPVTYNYMKRIFAPYYQDTVVFKLPSKIGTLGYGENQFEAYVDANFEITEYAGAENNNGLLSPISIYIQSDDVVPIYPYEFAIVPQQGVTLKASTINPFAPARNYRFQIDTTEKFNSGSQYFQELTVFQSGGVLHATPTITYKDSTVYYWRVAKDSSTLEWRYSSFIYLQNEYPGWNQSHVYQWLKDNYLLMGIDSTTRTFSFPPTTNEIKVTTGRADAVGGGTVSATQLGWDYNNVNMHRFRMGSCGFTMGGLTFAVINNVSGLPWTSTNTNGDNFGDRFGNYHCANQTAAQYGFDFAPTGNNGLLGISWSQAISNFIDSVPNGYYVLIYTENTPAYSNWDATLTGALQNLGVPSFPPNGGHFVFFTQKGNSLYVPHYSQVANNGPLTSSITFQGSWTSGSFTSPPIGPAFEWGSMHWDKFSLENPSQDKDTVDIIGINQSGVESVLLSTTQPNNFIQNISASTYPFLRLRLRTSDMTLRTPTQMRYWRILYKKAPEAAMNPAAHFVFTDSLSLGGNLNLEIGLENVTEIDMDSMLTHFTIRDAAFNTYDYDIRFDSLRALDILHLKLNQPVTGNNYNGINKIFIEANPNDDQLEQYHFNNYAELEFKTTGDNINPLLDVTFDGQHIFNGDIVSSKPTIMVTVRDENQFLALNDTGLVDVYLKYPNDPTPRRMAYDGVITKFFPADSNNLNSKNNKAQIELTPTLDIDGKYELIVKDRDRSGNNSSSTTSRSESNIFYDYKISFEVINKAMVTNVLNYPNPFTTATKFVFTITGSEVPDFMKIQIMTIKGTVVKEILKDELGPLHIGRNITEYTWNGRDEYGDLLANGVYFYRVVTRLDDKQMDHLSQGYDKYFKKGFGKMVIIR